MKAILWIAAGCALALGATTLEGCDGARSQDNVDSETDADVDADADADADSDGDADTNVEFCDEGNVAWACGAGPVTSLALTDGHNYTYTGKLHVTSQTVKSIPAPNLENLTFNWGGLTRSFMDETVNPANDVDLLLVTAWRLTPEALEEAFINDKLSSGDRYGAVCNETGGAVVQDDLYTGMICQGESVLDEMDQVANFFNAADPIYDPTQITHMAVVKSGTNLTGDLNVKMVQFFTLSLDSQNTQVVVDDNSAMLDWHVDLRKQTRVPVSVGNPSITLSWEDVHFNGLGNEFIPTQITRVVAAHYPMNICELEKRFLHIETIYDAWYEVRWTESHQRIDLSELKDASGNSFPGITANGVWIVALFCADCMNPAPWFTAVLQPC